MAPIIDKVTEELEVELLKVDADLMQNEDLLQQYDIMSIPTLVVVYEGREISSLVGEISEADFRNWLQEQIAKVNEQRNKFQDTAN